jgi:DNA topoisomerase-3
MLMKRSDVHTIINACDVGREGELIFDLPAYEHCHSIKQIQRLCISSMEESAITEGFAKLKDRADYDNLYHAALCRSKADWLVG